MIPANCDEYNVVVLGGGLAGLSSAYHLNSHSCLVLERESGAGGTARSFRFKRFTFDITGHLLHLHHPYTRRLISRLLKNRFFSCTRNTWIFSKATYTPYPFQANTHGLPENVVNECLLGFFDTALQNQRKKPKFSKLNFRDWCISIFGPGISRHFMIPYNEKLFQVRAEELTVDWCGQFVPRPKLEDVIKGAIESHTKKFGYNPTFLYPKRGGIQVLSEELMKKIKGDVRLNSPVEKIYWREKKVKTESGRFYSYKFLINTMPLPELLKRLSPLPASIRSSINKLKHVGILCLNMGVRRSRISDKSWIYFPEKDFLFYRVGFPMNFTPHAVPKGHSSMYVEIPLNKIKKMTKSQIFCETRRGLENARIIKKTDKIPVVQFLPVRYAYVVYDRNRKRTLKKIFSFLQRNHIQTIGRYGAWKYSFMEEAILDGKAAAEKIR